MSHRSHVVSYDIVSHSNHICIVYGIMSHRSHVVSYDIMQLNVRQAPMKSGHVQCSNVFILVPCVNFLILEGKALKRRTRKLWGCLFAVMNCGFVCVSQKSICWLTCTLQIIGRTPLHFAESKSQVYYFLLQVMYF